MIITALGVLTPAELCSADEVLVIELPAVCQCSGRLWRNGSYERTLKVEQGLLPVQITRLRCRDCNGNYSALYTFMLPYKRHCESVYRERVEAYLGGESYETAAWATDEMQASTLFRVIKQGSAAAATIAQELQAECVEHGLEPSEWAKCRLGASRDARKGWALACLKQGLSMIRQLLGNVSSAVFFWWEKVPAMYRRADLVYRLSAPQSLQRTLF